LCRKNYHLIELGYIREEIVYARSFGCPPTMLPLARYEYPRKSEENEVTHVPGGGDKEVVYGY
jgi:hypothetical protein